MVGNLDGGSALDDHRGEPQRERRFPLSPGQRQLWLAQQLAPDSTAYHIARAFVFAATLDLELLQRAIRLLIERHATLRTVFTDDAGEPRQIVREAMPFTLQPLAAGRCGDRKALLALWAEHAKQPFDLEHGPLLRVSYIDAGDGRLFLGVVMHHLVSDAWSNDIWLVELGSVYRALLLDRPATAALPPLKVQYVDIALRLEDFRASEDYARQVRYWREYLSGETDRVRFADPGALSTQAAQAGTLTVVRKLDARASDDIKRYCAARRLPPFCYFLTCWFITIGRFTGAAGFLVGVPNAGRQHEDVEGLIGFFAGMQAIKATLAPGLPISALMQATLAGFLDGLDHADVSPADILAGGGGPVRGDDAGLFQTVFDFKVARGGRQGLGDVLAGLDCEEIELPQGEAKFPAVAEVVYADDEVQCRLHFDRLKVHAGQAEPIADYFCDLAARIAADNADDLALADIAVLPRDAGLLYDWGRPATPAYDPRPVHEHIAARAAAAPQAIALIHGDEQLTYAELEARSSLLARHLASLGAGPEKLVGVSLTRSPALLVGLLAVLKTGAAYVPLDPDYPAERLRYMIEDSGIALVLTQADSRAALVLPERLPVLEIDRLGERAPLPVTAPVLAPAPAPVATQGQHLAYVIYTSGSTGQPKGVGVPHAALTMHCQAIQARYGMRADDRELQFASINFDIAHERWLVALMSGAALVLFDIPRADTASVIQEIRRHGVTSMFLPPSYLGQVVRTLEQDDDTLRLRLCVVGGEGWTRDSVVRAGARLRVDEWVNAYGPTETVIAPTAWTVGGAVHSAYAPIGRPIGARSAYVLDRELNLAPVGVAGELYLGGAGLARGYVGKPAMTAERFVPDVFGPAGGRLYRTGDLVRWNADGQLEYLGRSDHQVKIRGFRIEPGEVEARLQALAGVRDAVVAAVQGPDGMRLVAYVTARDGYALDTRALRAQLGALLPDYMVPAALVVLASLPLTANGKIDRKALPAPEFGAQEYEAPQGAVEEALAEAWQAVLGVARVGRQDNFFELGGDSILSLQIVARVRQAGWNITPRQLFEQQTVALLATVAQPMQETAPAPLSRPEGDVPLLPIQHWFFEQAIPNRHHWNQALLLQTRQALDPRTLAAALEIVIQQHDALRLRYRQSADGQWHQAYDPAADASTVLWVRQAATTDEIETLCGEAQRSLDLEHGPLLRALAIEVADGTWRLLLAIHHLVVDGVSWRILLEDLQAAYAHGAAGKAPVLPARTASYKDWALGLVRYAETHPEESAYWAAHRAAPDLAIPGVRAQGENLERHAAHASLRLDAGLTRQLLQVAPAAYRSRVDELLLVALGRALCAWTNQEQVHIDLEGHGREDVIDGVDVSRTVGWFTCVYPARFAPTGPLGAAIGRVKETLRAIPAKGLGHGALRYLGDGPSRMASRGMAPAAVAFNYLGQFDGSFGADSMWQPASESAGPLHDADTPLGHELTVSGQVYQGELRLAVAYSHQRYDAPDVEAFMARYRQELQAVVAHCTSGATGVTPADFPLVRLDQDRLDALVAATGLAASSLEDIYPLSPMQSGILFHSLYAPQGAAYVNQLRLDIEGLDVARFESAWAAAVARHAILRTGFVQQDEQLLQWVARTARLPFELREGQAVASSEDAPADSASSLDQAAAAELARGLDLARPPLMRLLLIRTGAHRHHFIWTHHHVLMDGWSVSQLLGEVLRLYGRGGHPRGGHPEGGHPEGGHPQAGRPHADLASPRGRYRDYIGWLQARDAEQDEAYWRAQTARLDTPTRLAGAIKPADVESQGAGDLGHGEYTLSLDAAGTASLAEFARRERITVNTLVQGAWALLLSRHTGQTTVSFGATVAGRPAEVEGSQSLLGLFINTLPVIVTVEPWRAVADWLRQLQAQALQAREHEYTPLYEIQRWAGVAGQGLFDTLLVFENYPVDAALKEGTPAGLRFAGVNNRELTNYPLTLSVGLADTLVLQCSYARQWFDRATAERLAQLVLRLVTEMSTAAPCVGDIQGLTQSERDGLLRLGTARARGQAQGLVHHQIEAHARAEPQRTAVMFDGAVMCYGELNEKANALAARLIQQGAGPEVRIGISIERSPDLIVAVLAVLKTGAAYVPLDPSYPADRLDYIVRDSGIGLLLIDSTAPAAFTALRDVSAVDMHGAGLAPGREGKPAQVENPEVIMHPANLAYVIYTSGSTGRPKGVGVSHDALARHVRVATGFFDISKHDRVLQFSTFNFDGFVEQCFPALCLGAAIVMRGPRVWTSAEFARQVSTQGITVADLTTAYWHLLVKDLEHHGIRDLAPLRRIHVGGEAMSPEMLQTWQRLGYGNVALLNTYGPTEAVVTASARVFDPGRQAPRVGAAVSIGGPLEERALYVVDRELALVSVGVIGELCIGGDLLARGYLNKAAVTAERFVPDPFGTAGARMYRTGDLVRWTHAGDLEYIGRMDHQVKIRGFRIELGEIEAQLQAQAGVRSAIVVALQGAGGARLVGYVAAESGHVLAAPVLREKLAAVLPDYMLPSAVVVLDRLPLNANGKIDRGALPAPLADGQAYEAPEGHVEEMLAQIWKDVLALDRVGRNDNFFALGGHSLTALDLVSRVNRQCQVEVPVPAIFNAATLADLSREVASLLDGRGGRDLFDELDAFLDELEEK